MYKINTNGGNGKKYAGMAKKSLFYAGSMNRQEFSPSFKNYIPESFFQMTEACYDASYAAPHAR